MSDSLQDTPLTPARKKVYIAAILLILTTSTASSYGGNVVLPAKLLAINGMDYYSVCTALQSMGMMMALPLVGMLCSRFGTKTIVLTGILIQLITRIAAIFIVSVPLFLLLWMLGGICCGLYISAPYAMMSELVTAKERPKYFGFLATFNALGALIGPFWTGTVADSSFSALAFICYLPLAVFPLIVLLGMYPNKKHPSGSHRFDFTGILFLVIAICCIVLWLSLGDKLFPRFGILGILLGIAGILSLLFLIKYELHQANPSVPVKMFLKKRFAIVFLVQMLLVAYSSCAPAYGIVYVQQIMHGSSLASSTVTMPQTIVQAVVGLFIGAYVGKAFCKRFRPIALLALILYTVSMAVFYMLRPDSSMLVIYAATALGGVGQAITQSIYAPFFQTELQPEEFGAAQGMYSFAGTGGSCIFMAICGAAINGGFTLNQVFLLGLIFCAAALCIGLVGFRFPAEEK